MYAIRSYYACQTQPSDKKAEAEMKETVMEEAPAMVEEVAPDSTAMEEDSLAVDAPESEEVVEVAE